MHTRSEPRFNVQSAVRVAAVDQPGDVSPALLLDVSGSGMKIISDRDWPLDSRIVVEMENHVVLARVRNAHARGTRFSIGAEKLHSVLKLMLPLDAPREEWHRILIQELGQTPAPPLAPEEAVALEAESEDFWNELEPPLTETSETETAVHSLPALPEGPAEHPPLDPSSPVSTAPADKPPVLDEHEVDARTVELLLRDLQELDRMEAGEQEVPQGARHETTALTQTASLLETTSLPEKTLETTPPVADGLQSAADSAAASDTIATNHAEPQVEVEHASLSGHALLEQIPAGEPLVASAPEYTAITELTDVTGKEDASVETVSASPEQFTSEEAHDLELHTPAAPEIATAERAPTVGQHEQKIEHTSAGQASSQSGEPPLASAFPLLPAPATRPSEVRISLPVTPQFGPAYGMAPTGDMLTPISTIEETVPETAKGDSPKPRWIVPISVAAALIGLAALAFYFGPFRPKASSATSTAATKTSEAPPPAIPPVTEKKDTPVVPGAATKIATNLAPGLVPPGAAKASAVPAASPQAPSKAKSLASPTPNGSPSKPVPSASIPIASTPAAPIPSKGSRRATVKASGMNWISTCSDGKPAFAGLLNAGNVKDIDFQRTAVVRVGNAAAAEIYVDGKSIGALGTPGTVKILEISGAGVRTLPPNLSPEAECQSKP